jgi:transcriptional regulator with XRE-family HTH domain
MENNFAERLKSLRKEKKLTLEELGKKVGVSKVMMSLYEKGEKAPKVATLQKLADVLEVSVDYLLGRSPFTQSEEHLLNNLELDLAEIKDKFDLKLHGEEITDEQMKAIIAFLQSYRSMRS